MRRLLAGTTALIVAVATAATAVAVQPSGGEKLKGTTSSTPFTGSRGQQFKDPVKIKVAAGGQSIASFKTGILNCQGTGGPPPRKNPYTSKGIASTFKNLPINSKGNFSKTTKYLLGGTDTTATVRGKFTRKKGKLKASGSVTWRQRFQGGKCGPAMMTYTAKQR